MWAACGLTSNIIRGGFNMFSVHKTYNLFISHSWNYSDQYTTIDKWLQESSIDYNNYSVTHDNPIETRSDRVLREKITEQIKHASVVIILSGMYVSHSNWIQYEVDEAISFGKPILAIVPRGNERIPLSVSKNASKIVYWNKESVIGGIKSLL